MTEEEAKALQPGQRVSRTTTTTEFDEDLPTTEYGVVIAVWTHPVTKDLDAYIAFFGEDWPPAGEPPPKPYVLRYFAETLDLED